MSLLTLDEFNRRFVYTPDHGRDRWTILTAKTGPLRGDCEDYALTVLWIEAGCDEGNMHRMVWRGNAYPWFTHTPPPRNNGHMMLWRRGKGWIDNNHPKWSPTAHYVKEERVNAALFEARLWLKG